MELEIDALRPDTLWRLQELLDRPLGRHFAMGKAVPGIEENHACHGMGRGEKFVPIL